jgi:hypothetical protein
METGTIYRNLAKRLSRGVRAHGGLRALQRAEYPDLPPVTLSRIINSGGAWMPHNSAECAMLGVPTPPCTRCNRPMPRPRRIKPTPEPVDEAPRRVLTGAWKYHGKWVSIEELFQ